MQPMIRTVLSGFAITALVATAACTRDTVSPVSPASPTATAPAEQTAPATAAIAAAPLKSGSFVAAEHPTQGGVRIVEENGSRYLEIDDTFQTDAGPDLVVILHQADDILATTAPPAYPIEPADYIELGELQATSGAQRYLIPAEVALADYGSAAVWCRQFNATFGAAALR